jgi:DNA topoisomerase I
MPARKAGLARSGIRRVGTKEAGFRYETAAGEPVEEEKLLGRIRALRIPPAWKNVRIARGEHAPLQATGVDAKGRTQYIYHLRFRQKREDEKYLRIVEFGERLPDLRARVRSDLSAKGPSKERVLAALVRLIDQGFFRVGNDRSVKSTSTFGLTTVRAGHVKVRDDEVAFDFVGKWRKTHRRAIKDRQIASLVRELKALDGREELFAWVEDERLVDVKDRHVNEYIQSVLGPEFTAKDFRTWAGTLICSMALAWKEQADTKTGRKRQIKKAVETTAELLGNTPAVCRTSYICPRLLHDYERGIRFEPMRKKGHPIPRTGLSVEEKALLRFLRETIANRRARRRPSSRRFHAKKK